MSEGNPPGPEPGSTPMPMPMPVPGLVPGPVPGLVPGPVLLPGTVPGPAELAEVHERTLAADRRTERWLSWRELGCLLFVVVVVLVRERYLL